MIKSPQITQERTVCYMNHSIKKMLRLIDPNLTILEITQEKIKHQMALVIKADLSPAKCNYESAPPKQRYTLASI